MAGRKDEKMLEIAGGVILGGLGIILILWLIGLIAENAEDIASVFGFLLAALAVFGVWYFLDSEFPEIDWIKTALAFFGIIILVFFGYAYYIKNKPKMTEKEKRITENKNYQDKLNKNSSIGISSYVIYLFLFILFLISTASLIFKII